MTKTKKYIVLGLAAFIFAGVVLGVFAVFYLKPDSIMKNVYIESVEVGGLEPQTAREEIQPAADRLLQRKIIFQYEDRSWEATLDELGVTVNTKAAVNKALNIGHQGSIFTRIREMRLTKNNGYRMELPVAVNAGKVRGMLASLTEDLNEPAVDATFSFDRNDTIRLVPEKTGTKINTNQAVADLKASIPFLRSHSTKVISLSMEQIKPGVMTADLEGMGLKGVLGSFSTSFNPANVNRTYNLNVAADALNNQLIKVGEEFSFNRIVGPRSEEAGYKEALVIVNNQFVPGVGGGVCQVSTTLYNALLRAGITATERNNHSLIVPYVPPGLDATVYYGGLDLKFRNDTDSYLLLRSKVAGGVLTVKILGNTDYKKSVRIISKVDQEIPYKTISKPDPNLETGKEVVEQEGAKGYRASVRRQFFSEGKLTLTELISQDVYKPLDKIIRVGTMPVINPSPEQPPGDPGTLPPDDPGTLPPDDVPVEPQNPEEPQPGEEPADIPG